MKPFSKASDVIESDKTDRLHPDAEALAVARELKARLRRRFGDRLRALYLFGSRARGDHRPASDVDVAVVFAGPIGTPFDLEAEIIEDSYDLLLERGLYIQPWAIDEAALADPDKHREPHLTHAVLRDGVPV